MHDVMAKPLTKLRSKISRQAIKKSPASKTLKAARKAAPKAASVRIKAAKGKWVYAFGGGKAEGRAAMRNLLGGKGAGLAEMAQLGLPVPPGFTITTEVCTYFYQHGKTYPKELKRQVDAALAEIGRVTDKKFGDRESTLLVSVRSGARASMPGMMDTVLNLGLNDVTVKALAAKSGDRRFALDSYRRFITMYSDVVLGNMGESSATGVAFTRNPSTGEKKLYGEYLINAQGEDVVAGIRTPQEI